MAYEKDDQGCWLEPVAEIRSAAASLLQICPPIIEPANGQEGPRVEGVQREGQQQDDEKKENNDNEGNNSGDSTQSTQNGAIHAAKFRNGSMTIGDQSPTSNLWSSGNSGGPQSSTTSSRNRASTNLEIDPNMIGGSIQQVSGKVIHIKLSDSFLLPQGAAIIVKTETGIEQEMTIVSSQISEIVVRPTSGDQTNWDMGTAVYIGILSTSN